MQQHTVWTHHLEFIKLINKFGVQYPLKSLIRGAYIRQYIIPWLQAGTILAVSRRLFVFLMVKFEIPMALHRPCSTSCSIAFKKKSWQVKQQINILNVRSWYTAGDLEKIHKLKLKSVTFFLRTFKWKLIILINITAKIIMCMIHEVADEKQPETKIQAVPLKEQCKECRAVRLSGSWNFLVKNGIELISPCHRGLN